MKKTGVPKEHLFEILGDSDLVAGMTSESVILTPKAEGSSDVTSAL